MTATYALPLVLLALVLSRSLRRLTGVVVILAVAGLVLLLGWALVEGMGGVGQP